MNYEDFKVGDRVTHKYHGYSGTITRADKRLAPLIEVHTEDGKRKPPYMDLKRD